MVRGHNPAAGITPAGWIKRGERIMYAVILAGGTGERFWPLSRRANPKQFLSLFGNRTMLQLTMDKLQGLVAPSELYVVTDEIYRDLVGRQLPEIPADNIICEPCGRDTAAAIGLAAAFVQRRDPRGVMAVLPADHYVVDVAGFQHILKVAVKAADSGEWAVTIGIRPSRPETGYGYIQLGSVQQELDGVAIYRAQAFCEKPNLEQAMDYLARGDYLWNSGMFIWRADLIRSLIAHWLPQLDSGLAVIEQSLGTSSQAEVIRDIYKTLPRISVDYGIMEKSDRVWVIPASFGWDDVGSWTALGRYREADTQGNVLEADGVFIDTRECLVYSPQRVVATLGVEGLLIVDNGDSLLICGKDRAQEIKKVVEALKKAGYKDII